METAVGRKTHDSLRSAGARLRRSTLRYLDVSSAAFIGSSRRIDALHGRAATPTASIFCSMKSGNTFCGPSPEFATTVGDKRYNDRLSDHSPEFFKSDLEQKRKFLARFEAIDPRASPAGRSQPRVDDSRIAARYRRRKVQIIGRCR